MFFIENNHCEGMSIIHPDIFNPVRPGMDKQLLWRQEPVGHEVWDDLFAPPTRGIHFYSSSSNRIEVHDRKLHAYAYLGPKYCPLSYYGSTSFKGSYIV
jgi:hypothetical protein